MNEIPDFWRAEIWHPLSIHLPLALLIAGSLFYVFSLIIRKDAWLKPAGIFVLIGTLGAWVAVYTGNLADAAVARGICDPTVLEAHEQNAWVVTGFFTAASLLIVFSWLNFWQRFKKWMYLVIIALMLAGSGFLIYTGHLGATLVYQQAAGVHQPSEDCTEFE